MGADCVEGVCACPEKHVYSEGRCIMGKVFQPKVSTIAQLDSVTFQIINQFFVMSCRGSHQRSAATGSALREGKAYLN